MRKRERDTVLRLIDQFDAEVLVNLTPPPTMSRAEILDARRQARKVALMCQGCGLHRNELDDDTRGPIWPEHRRVDLIVLTPHPQPARDRYMRMIKAALRKIEYVSEDKVAWIGAISCVPRAENRALTVPQTDHRHACEANLYQQLHAANCPNVLIVGKKAMDAWRTDLTISQVEGLVGIWRDTWTVTVVDHPGSHVGAGKIGVLDWQKSLRKAVELLMDESAVLRGIGNTCVVAKCSEESVGWDPDGIPWCADHFNFKDRKRTRDFTNRAML